VLLVGGASRRFGSPKALARLGAESLAERCFATLADAFGADPIVVGKAADGLALPFPLLDDGSDLRAPIVGLGAALRHAGAGIAVVLPTDMPWVSPALLRNLAAAARERDAAVVPTGPLPGAYRCSLRPLVEARIAAGALALRDLVAAVDAAVVAAEPDELRNVNAPEDLAREQGC